MWSDVKCSDVEWTDVIYVKWFYFEAKWTTVNVGDKSAVYIRTTLYWGYVIVLWLLRLVCILYCSCFNWFCNVWVYVCVDFVMCGGSVNMCTCIYCGLYYFYCVFGIFSFMYIYSYLFRLYCVRIVATEWQLNCINNNNNNIPLRRPPC
jgi:hypothetical protein